MKTTLLNAAYTYALVFIYFSLFSPFAEATSVFIGEQNGKPTTDFEIRHEEPSSPQTKEVDDAGDASIGIDPDLNLRKEIKWNYEIKNTKNTIRRGSFSNPNQGANNGPVEVLFMPYWESVGTELVADYDSDVFALSDPLDFAFGNYNAANGTIANIAGVTIYSLTSSEAANWNTISIGSLTLYTGALSSNSIGVVVTSTVPIPATFWIFGSGLLGLIGVARRKKSA